MDVHARLKQYSHVDDTGGVALRNDDDPNLIIHMIRGAVILASDTGEFEFKLDDKFYTFTYGEFHGFQNVNDMLLLSNTFRINSLVGKNLPEDFLLYAIEENLPNSLRKPPFWCDYLLQTSKNDDRTINSAISEIWVEILRELDVKVQMYRLPLSDTSRQYTFTGLMPIIELVSHVEENIHIDIINSTNNYILRSLICAKMLGFIDEIPENIKNHLREYLEPLLEDSSSSEESEESEESGDGFEQMPEEFVEGPEVHLDDYPEDGWGVEDIGIDFNSECTICLQATIPVAPISVTLHQTTNCSRPHIFHSTCLKEWLQRNNGCPLDRKTVDGVVVHQITPQTTKLDIRSMIHRALPPSNQKEPSEEDP